MAKEKTKKAVVPKEEAKETAPVAAEATIETKPAELVPSDNEQVEKPKTTYIYLSATVGDHNKQSVETTIANTLINGGFEAQPAPPVTEGHNWAIAATVNGLVSQQYYTIKVKNVLDKLRVSNSKLIIEYK